MTEDEYRQFVRDQRTEGREHVRRLCWDLRRRLFGRFPDPIDRENIALIGARLAEAGAAMRSAAERWDALRPQLAWAFDHNMAQWRAEQRVALAVLPDTSRVALITSPA